MSLAFTYILNDLQGVKDMTTISTFGVVFLAVSILVLIGGTLLLVFGISSTIKGKKRIGRIVAGGIMIFYGLATTFLSLIFVASVARTDTVSMATKESGSMQLIMTALKENDAQALEESFAKYGYSGEAPYKEDAAGLLKLIEGKVTSVEPSPTGVKFKNKNHCTTYKFIVHTDADQKYTVIAYVLTACSDERYLGVQRIRLTQNNEVLYEAGTVPDFN